MVNMAKNEITLTSNEVEKLIKQAAENGYEITQYEGVLLDNYILEKEEKDKIVIIKEIPITSWTSKNVLFFIDRSEKEKYVTMFEIN